MGKRQTLKDLLVEELERQNRPTSPKALRSLVLARGYRMSTYTARRYLGDLAHQGHVQAVQWGAYAPKAWSPPVNTKGDHLAPWLDRHLRDNPLTAYTKPQLNEAHESAWGVKAPAEAVTIALERLERSGIATRSRNMWMLAPDAPAVDPFS